MHLCALSGSFFIRVLVRALVMHALNPTCRPRFRNTTGREYSRGVDGGVPDAFIVVLWGGGADPRDPQEQIGGDNQD